MRGRRCRYVRITDDDPPCWSWCCPLSREDSNRKEDGQKKMVRQLVTKIWRRERKAGYNEWPSTLFSCISSPRSLATTKAVYSSPCVWSTINSTAFCRLVCGTGQQQSFFCCCCRSLILQSHERQSIDAFIFRFKKMLQMAVTSHALHTRWYQEEHTLAYIITQYSVDIHGSHWIWLFLVPSRRWNSSRWKRQGRKLK